MPFLALGCVVLLGLGLVAVAGLMLTPQAAPAAPIPTSSTTPAYVTTACGVGVDTLVPGYKMVEATGKLGNEEHLSSTYPIHYVGSDSSIPPVRIIDGGAFRPHTTDQERWYFNSQWGGWNWEPTRRHLSPRPIASSAARKARAAIPHAKLIVTSMETGRSAIVSAEESGPALWVTDRDGVNYGAPPEVYRYLGASSGYTGNPRDGKGQLKVSFVDPANQKSAKLGPCK